MLTEKTRAEASRIAGGRGESGEFEAGKVAGSSPKFFGFCMNQIMNVGARTHKQMLSQVELNSVGLKKTLADLKSLIFEKNFSLSEDAVYQNVEKFGNFLEKCLKNPSSLSSS